MSPPRRLVAGPSQNISPATRARECHDQSFSVYAPANAKDCSGPSSPLLSGTRGRTEYSEWRGQAARFCRDAMNELHTSMLTFSRR